ncbi:MAG: succinate dehydrogenase, hydrophobic membrane anchor protein [Burkholderiales bacterium]
MVNRTVIGAHYGSRDWLAQRVTAVIMVLYTFFFIGVLLSGAPFDFAKWKGVFATNIMRVATMMFFLCIFYHAWVGVRDILMDYIKPMGLRLGLQVLVILALVAYAIWSVSILWGA